MDVASLGGNGLKSLRLAFIRAHVAAGGFPSPGTRLAALVGLQKVAREVTAAGGIARLSGLDKVVAAVCAVKTRVSV